MSDLCKAAQPAQAGAEPVVVPEDVIANWHLTAWSSKMNVGEKYLWLGLVWTVTHYNFERRRCGREFHTLQMQSKAGDVTLNLEGAQALVAFEQSMEPV